MEPSSPADFVVPCESESLHLFHSLSPKKRLQFHCYEMLLMQRLGRRRTAKWAKGSGKT